MIIDSRRGGSYYFPDKSDLPGWVLRLREAGYSSPDEVMATHTMLHQLFGDSPSDAVLDGERNLSEQLRSIGIEHRYTDALSKAAGTLVQKPADPTAAEVGWYLRDITIRHQAVRLLRGVDQTQKVYLDVDPTFGVSPESVLKLVLRMLPPGFPIELAPSAPAEEYVTALPAYDLGLYPNRRATYVDPDVLLWQQVVREAPKGILKSADNGLSISPRLVHVVKAAADGRLAERYTFSEVLVPEEEDSQGEIYSHAEVRKACHYWAENSRAMSLKHVYQGGRVAKSGEVVPLENYVMPMDCTEINGEKLSRVIKSGTWVLGARWAEEPWKDLVLTGKIKAWSIGADALTWYEPRPD